MKEQCLKLKKIKGGVIPIQGMWAFAPFNHKTPLIFEIRI